MKIYNSISTKTFTTYALLILVIKTIIITTNVSAQDITCDNKIIAKLSKTPSQATSHLVGVLRAPLSVDIINWEAYTDIIYAYPDIPFSFPNAPAAPATPAAPTVTAPDKPVNSLGSNQFDQTYISSLVGRANKKVHVLAAVGNYGNGTAALWTAIKGDQISFVDPIVKHITDNNVDGVDIEYPRTECKFPDGDTNVPVLFGMVLQELRTKLGTDKIITATFGPNDYKDVKSANQGAIINAAVNWVNVIGYRLNIGLYPKQVEGPTSPFKDNPPKNGDAPSPKDDPPTTNDFITFKEVTDGWKTTNIFANKLVMGVEFSGIVRKVISVAQWDKTQNVQISTVPLTFPNSVDIIDSCVDLSHMKSISWTNMKQYNILTGDCESKNTDWTRIFDKATLSTYAYNNDGTYISYEDPESLLNKVLYVMTGNENGGANPAPLGGIMISDVAADLNDDLLSVIYHIRNNNGIPKKPQSTNSASPTPSDTSSSSGSSNPSATGTDNSTSTSTSSTSSPSISDTNTTTGTIVGCVIGVVVAGIAGFSLFWYFGYKKRQSMALNKSVNNNDYQNVSVPVSIIDKAVPDTPVSRVTALYDFEGKETTDLSFKKGDIIEVIEKGDGANDWWVGKIGSKIGEFPGNYVRE